MPKTTKIPGKLSQTLRVEHVLVDISRKYTDALSKYESEEGKLEVFSPFTNEELYKYIDIKNKESFLRVIKTEGVALTSTQKLDLSNLYF